MVRSRYPLRGGWVGVCESCDCLATRGRQGTASCFGSKGDFLGGGKEPPAGNPALCLRGRAPPLSAGLSELVKLPLPSFVPRAA
jgi:hypothetical protein